MCVELAPWLIEFMKRRQTGPCTPYPPKCFASLHTAFITWHLGCLAGMTCYIISTQLTLGEPVLRGWGTGGPEALEITSQPHSPPGQLKNIPMPIIWKHISAFLLRLLWWFDGGSYPLYATNQSWQRKRFAVENKWMSKWKAFIPFSQSWDVLARSHLSSLLSVCT